MGSGGGKAAVVAAWRESEEELRALATLPELAAYEWGDELKAMVNQLKLQVEHLQVAGPAPVQAQIVQVEVHEHC